METKKKKRLEAKGWKVGDTKDFLNLTEDEANYIELKVLLSQHLKRRRRKKRFTQVQMASFLKSSQSRVAKMEIGDHSVSLDLLIRSLFSLGATRREIAAAISPSKKSVAA